MPVDPAQPPQWISYVIMAVVTAFVLALRMRRMSRSRPLKLERLWMLPSLYLLLVGLLLYRFPLSGPQWALCAVALALGGALGWQRGRMMHIEVDPETHLLNQRASAGALVFLVMLVIVRLGARNLVPADGGPLHLNALILTDILLVTALGLFTVQRIEMYRRARALLAAIRPARR